MWHFDHLMALDVGEVVRVAGVDGMAVGDGHGSPHSRPAAMTRWRNEAVRALRGAVKICSGGPSSRIWPSCRKQTRSATSGGSLCPNGVTR